MTSYRIQLASNFQVVEFNIEVEDGEILTMDDPRVGNGVLLANELGKAVENTIKQREPAKTDIKVEELASEKQIKWLVNLGVKESDAKKMTKAEAVNYIKENR